MAVLHLSAAEFAKNLHGTLARLRAGEEVVIEGDDTPLILRASERPRFKSLEEVIAGLKAAEEERGYPLRMGKEFADDLEEIVARRTPRKSAWD